MGFQVLAMTFPAESLRTPAVLHLPAEEVPLFNAVQGWMRPVFHGG
jgi:hypothetical protein